MLVCKQAGAPATTHHSADVGKEKKRGERKCRCHIRRHAKRKGEKGFRIKDLSAHQRNNPQEEKKKERGENAP